MSEYLINGNIYFVVLLKKGFFLNFLLNNSLIVAAQNQSMRTNLVKVRTNKSQGDLECDLEYRSYC